jgi:hypothetical protein
MARNFILALALCRDGVRAFQALYRHKHFHSISSRPMIWSKSLQPEFRSIVDGVNESPAKPTPDDFTVGEMVRVSWPSKDDAE